MTYLAWFENHAKKHQEIVKKVPKEKLIEYFRWENLSKNEADFCPLFAENKKCHEMKKLNCYLCACPYFRFDYNAPKIKSWCAIDAKKGKLFKYEGIIHQDCSDCTIPHHERFIEKNFDTDWLGIMKGCHE